MSSLLVDLVADAIFRGPLVLLDCQPRSTKTGSMYLDLKLRDRSLEISGKRWQSTEEELQGLRGQTFVYVIARVESYQGKSQLKVESIEPYAPSADELQNLVRASAWESSLLWREIRQHLRHEITDDALWAVIECAMEDPDVRDRAHWIAAANTNHHAYRSGLAEHMLSMLRMSAQVVRHYENYYPIPIHRGLIAAGIFFHDLGKIWELEGDVQTTYTTEGRLLGHIFMAANWLTKIGEQAKAPRELIVELQHIVLSHHGQLEYGSPKRPKTVEAMIVHHIDKLDADMNHWMHELKNAQGWTPYQRNYERPLFRADLTREAWAGSVPATDVERGPGIPVDAHKNGDLSSVSAQPGPPAELNESLSGPQMSPEIGPIQETSSTKLENDRVHLSKPERKSNDLISKENNELTLNLFDGLSPRIDS